MEARAEPPQAQGRLRKALKLLGKRRQGEGGSVFGIRSNAGAGSPEREGQGEGGTSEEGGHRGGGLAPSSIRQSISSLTSARSLGFLTTIRKSRKDTAGQARSEALRPGRPRGGLRGLFGNVRWTRKDKGDGDGGGDVPDPGPPLLASRSGSIEITKENLTLTPGPAHGPEEAAGPSGSSGLSSPLGDLPSILGDVDRAGLEAGGGMVADVEAEWAKVSRRVEEGEARRDPATPELTPSPMSTHPEPSRPSPEPREGPTCARVASPRPAPSPLMTKPALSHTSTFHAAPALTPPALTPPSDAPSSVPTPEASPIPAAGPAPVPVPASPTDPPTAPAHTPASPPTPEPSPTSSPTTTPSPSPASTPVDVPAAQRSCQGPAPEMGQPVRGKATPRYPPFITSTKPPPAAPPARPKIVTTFGLSTGRNTAPIAKTDAKQPRSSPPASACATSPTGAQPESPWNPPPAAPPPHPVTKGEKEQHNISSRRGPSEPLYRPVRPAALSKIPVSGGVRAKQPPGDTPPSTSNGHTDPPAPAQDQIASPVGGDGDPSDASAESGAVSPVGPRGPGGGGVPRESRIPVKPGSTAAYTSLQGRTDAARSKIPVSKVPGRRTGTKPTPGQE